MYNFQQQVHFIGIGGVGMAGIAEVLISLGYRVSGSDLKNNPLIEKLKSIGAEISIGHHQDNLGFEAGVVVYSSAIGQDNPELTEAKKRGIPLIPRAEMLAELMRMKYGIAIAGAHGKTTTTSMCGSILRALGFDPTIIVGGRLLTDSTGARVGGGQYLVAEADESDGSFCLLRPAIAVITNIDSEHLSHYGSVAALEKAFYQFMSSLPFYGLIIACGDDPVVVDLAEKVERRVLRYGLGEDCELRAVNLELAGPISSFDLVFKEEKISRVKLPLSGAHMVSNSLAAIAVAIELGASPEDAGRSLASFPGVSRRTEVIGNEHGVLVIDDYGHHPTEIKATLKSLRRGWLPYQAQKCRSGELGRLIVLFEPHRYTRTYEIFNEFLDAFSDADQVFIGDIYAAGEAEIPEVNARRLAEALKHPQASYAGDLKMVLPDLVRDLKPADVVLTLGAGAVCSVAKELVELLAVGNSAS